MHNAPSVTYPVGRSPFLGRALALVWLAGVGATAAGWGSAEPGWRLALACAVLLLAAGMAWRFWRALPTGVLRWDGHAWQGPPNDRSFTALSVHLDLQRHLLVRLHGESAPDAWLWLAARSEPARWNDVRRAVYSRAMPEARQDAANP